MQHKNLCKDILFGICVGDAVGVPVEFRSRSYLQQNPVVDIIGYGTHNVPPGTWSDDTSMTLCLAEVLIDGYDLGRLANNFVRWYKEGFWTPHGTVFDIGIATRSAIQRLINGVPPETAGGFDEQDNGNGSLMRILPLLFHIDGKSIEDRFQITKDVSSITHAHIRSIIACFYYLEYARLLLHGQEKKQAYNAVKQPLIEFCTSKEISTFEINRFSRLLTGNIYEMEEAEIRSTGYVLDTLEASVWCFLTTDSYKEAVLKAVNLGFDTDTTGAVTGGLAGLYYGYDNIPSCWINKLARKDDIQALASNLSLSK